MTNAWWTRLGRWSGKRVAVVSVGWALLLFAVTIAHAILAARAYHRAHPGEETYIVSVGMPGGLRALVGPPLLLVVAWLWARSRARRDA